MLRILLIFLIAGSSLQAQQSTGAYKSGFKKEGNRFHFNTANAKVIIEFCTPSMFRVRTSWSGKFEENEPWMVKRYEWPAVKITASEKTNAFELSTPNLQITINQSPFKIIVSGSNGNMLSSDALEMYTKNDS